MNKNIHVESVCITVIVICKIEEGVSSFIVEDWRKAQEKDEVISFWKQHDQVGGRGGMYRTAITIM